MQTKTKFIIFIALVVIIIGGFGVYSAVKSKGPNLDSFAQCIKASGAEFYGTFWCSHCQNQKKLFGSAKQYLPYIECANTDGNQNQLCKDKGIEGYPTWIFADGSHLSGEAPLQTLAEKTKCLLPQ